MMMAVPSTNPYVNMFQPHAVRKEALPFPPGERFQATNVPWTYPFNIPPGVINAAQTPPIALDLIQLEDGTVVNRDKMVMGKMAPGTYIPLNVQIRNAVDKNAAMAGVSQAAVPNANANGVIYPPGTQVAQYLPVPAPMPTEAPPRSKNLNRMDYNDGSQGGGDYSEKIGDAQIPDNPQMSAEMYKVHVSAKDGDCFFSSVQLALASININVTVEQLRAAVAKTVLDPRNKDVDDAIMLWQTMYTEARKCEDKAVMTEYGHIACVADDMLPLDMPAREKLYASMMTKSYWADEYALYNIERALQIKFLVLEGERKVALMGHDHGPHWRPKYYIILVLSRMHYQPVSSRGKFCFKRNEIPKDVVDKFNHDCALAPNCYQSLKPDIQIHSPSEISPLPIL